VLVSFLLLWSVFSYLFDELHQNNAEQELKSAFGGVEVELTLRSRRLREFATDLASDIDVISGINLVNLYQDKTQYQALIFDIEKRKLSKRFASARNLLRRFYVAAYDTNLELAAYTYRGGLNEVLGGIKSYKDGKPVLMAGEIDGKLRTFTGLPGAGSQIVPARLVENLEHEYRISAGVLVHAVSVPVFLPQLKGAGKVIGMLQVVEILDDEFSRQVSQRIGHPFSIQLPAKSEFTSYGLLPIINKTGLPRLFENSREYSFLPNDLFFIGAAALGISGGREATIVLGVDKQALISGGNAFRKSLIWVLIIVAAVLLPIGILVIRHTLTRPIENLMSGVKALSERKLEAVSGIESNDEIGGLTTAFNDMAHTVRRREEELEFSRDQLRMITDNLPVLILLLDSEERYCFVNKTCVEWFARPINEIIGMRSPDIHKEEYKNFQSHTRRVLGGETITFDDKFKYPDGKERIVRQNMIPQRDASGKVVGVFVLAEDITDISIAEEQLRQSQKMEAVGQLTGGIAHDFNNLLAIMMGNAEFIVESDREELEELAETIRNTAGRGAELTQRLLAFSRQQTLNPQTIDLADLVGKMSDLLTRTLGETVHITTRVQPGLWKALADPGQVENTLLNLAINARDAMPVGGQLTIEVLNQHLGAAYLVRNANASEGDFVVLSVSDTGTGMEPDILSRVFEPFFTTKEIGRGTGLGLSMIYGFVQQSGGHVSIDSELGRGTTVKVFLPRGNQVLDSADIEKNNVIPLGKGERILLVEDDPDVARLVNKLLDSLGYQVVLKTSAVAALQLLKSHERFDLILTDVVLPQGMSGPELAAEAVSDTPELKVIFMSGYTAEAFTDYPFPDAGNLILSKPFHRKELARALREALD
jgi:PAS domain S-box-containing protein